MTRQELLERIENISGACFDDNVRLKLVHLHADIVNDGVLDVQCPPDIAEKMNLPRPVGRR